MRYALSSIVLAVGRTALAAPGLTNPRATCAQQLRPPIQRIQKPGPAIARKSRLSQRLTERAGFEPAVRLYSVRRFSKPVVSATHPPLQIVADTAAAGRPPDSEPTSGIIHPTAKTRKPATAAEAVAAPGHAPIPTGQPRSAFTDSVEPSEAVPVSSPTTADCGLPSPVGHATASRAAPSAARRRCGSSPLPPAYRSDSEP